MDTKIIRRVLFGLSTTAAVLTLAGLLLALSLRYAAVSEALLSHYPQYKLAMRGFHTLQHMEYPVNQGPGKPPVSVGVLPIEDPSWSTMMRFIQSDTAFLKSDRNDPPPPPKGQPPLPPVNFARIKTIVSVRSVVLQAGNEPLLPPYSLDVFWPGTTAQKMYEFRSWDEFRLDLRQTMAQRLETMSWWFTLMAFVLTVLAGGLQKLVDRRQQTKEKVEVSPA